MSWGDGKFMDYCYGVKEKMAKKGLKTQREIDEYLNNRWRYVSQNANVDKEVFMASMKQVIKEK